MERKYIRIDENGNFVADEWHMQKPDDENVIETLPPQGLFQPKWDGVKWVEGKLDSERLADVKQAKKNELFQACESEINSGFLSSIQGTDGNNIEFSTMKRHNLS